MYQTESALCPPLFRQTALVVSLCLAYGLTGAQEVKLSPDDVRKDLYTLENTLSLGLGHQFSDNRRFGQYRDITDEGGYGLLDLSLASRDEATGRWLKFKANNTGLRLEHERQGDWSYFVQGNQMSRSEPLVVNTGLQGVGTARQSVAAVAAAKRDVDIKIDHNIYALGLRKFLGEGFDVRISAKQDDKSGARIYGRGTFGATGGMEFLTEPVDTVTRQWEVVASYANRKLQLLGGYSGSSFDNQIPVLSVSGGAAGFASAPAMNAFAMPLSNHAHQLHLAGGYNWSDMTRSSFKLSRTSAYQNETFSPLFTTRLAGSPDSLNGKVVTTLAFTDLTMRPMDKLDLTGSLRYEDRDDQTPEAQFIANSGSSASSAGVTGINKPRQLKQIKGSFEANYRLDGGYRLVGSLEQEEITRNGSRDKIRVAYREKTTETTERIEIKRTMSETLNGGVALLHSERSGSEYIRDTYVNPEVSNKLSALMWSDRSRNKLRLNADWIPTEDVSLQLLADLSDDTYSGDALRILGPSKGHSRFYSADASFKVNDKWNLSGWLSLEETSAQQLSGDAVRWDADLRDTTKAWGIGLKGKLRSNLEGGVDLSSSLNVAESTMSKLSGTGNVVSLPDYYYKQTALKLYGDYALSRSSGIHVDLVIDRRHNNDWTWQNWTYSDGTTVTNVPSENSAFLGISYRYRWR